MDLFLLHLSAFLRPILLIELGQANLFDAAAIALFSALLAAFFIRTALGRGLQLSLLDFLIVAFVVWCVSCYLLYPDKSDLKNLAKLIIPPAIYIVAKNVLRDRSDYLRMLWLIIVSFTVPVVWSLAVILAGGGKEIYGDNYWTGIPRWEGVFAGAHNLGHNMTFLLMTMGVYLVIRRSHPGEAASRIGRTRAGFLLLLAAAALTLLWLSQVRTALLGLLVFVYVFLFFVNRRWLIILTAAAAVAFLAFLPILLPYLFPDIIMIEKAGVDMSYLASARPHVWGNNLSLFADLPFDRQIAGVGIGNKHGFPADTGEGFTDSHNDFLDVMVQTGVVGLLLYVMLQVALYGTIRNLKGNDKYVFLALFLAVIAMNLGSNSYVTRFGLAQMLYMALAFIELRALESQRVPSPTPPEREAPPTPRRPKWRAAKPTA